MKEWIKPELYIEEFELSQHVAAGCGVRVPIKGSGSVTVTAMCTQPNDSSHILTGQGHYNAENVTIYDTDNDGRISWDEVYDQFAGMARNGKKTGAGHLNQHNGQLVVGNVQYDWDSQPFNS